MGERCREAVRVNFERTLKLDLIYWVKLSGVAEQGQRENPKNMCVTLQ